MIARRRGRRRTAMEAADKALAPFGGVRPFIEALDRTATPYAEIADRLHQQTGVRVTNQTIINWLRYWTQQGEQQEVTTA